MGAGLTEGEVLALLAGGVAAALPAGMAIAGLIEMAACALCWAWRRSPAGRRHAARASRRKDQQALAGLQAELWPRGEWEHVIRAYTEEAP